MDLVNVDNINQLREIDRPAVEAEINREIKKGNREKEEIETNREKKIPQNTPIIILGIILSIIFLKFLIGFIKVKLGERKIKKLPNKERLIQEYNEILRLTKSLGYPLKPGETHYEYANRVAYRFSTFGALGIQEITNIFVENKYSERKTKDSDIEKIVEYKGILKKRLKKHLGLGGYLFEKYF